MEVVPHERPEPRMGMYVDDLCREEGSQLGGVDSFIDGPDFDHGMVLLQADSCQNNSDAQPTNLIQEVLRSRAVGDQNIDFGRRGYLRQPDAANLA